MTPFLLLSKSATWSLEKPLHESFPKPPFHLSKPHHPITTNHHHTSCGKLPGMELLSKVSGQTHVNINFFDIKVILLIIYKPFVKKIYPKFFSTFRYFSRASPFFYLPTFGKLHKITGLATFRSLPSFSLARLAPCSSSSAELTRRKGGFLLATEKNDVAIVTQGWCLFFWMLEGKYTFSPTFKRMIEEELSCFFVCQDDGVSVEANCCAIWSVSRRQSTFFQRNQHSYQWDLE